MWITDGTSRRLETWQIMKIYILIEFYTYDDEEEIINVFTDEVLANKYLDSFRKNQPLNAYQLRIIDTTEEDLEDGND